MDDTPSPAISETNWVEQFTRRLSDQQIGTETFLTSHHEQLTAAHIRLREQVHAVVEQAAAGGRRLAAAQEDLDRKSDEIRQASERIAREKAQLDAQWAEWEQASRKSASQQEELEAQRAELAALRTRLENRAAELDQLQKAAAEAQSKTEIQRRKIAHELRAQRAAQAKEFERQKAQLDAQRAEWEEAGRKAASQQQEQEARRAELAALQIHLEKRAAELDQLQKAAADAQSQTEIQRRKIAHELKAQHAAQWKEIQRQRAELERHDNGEVGRLERQLCGVEKQRNALQAELESLGDQLQKQNLEAAEKSRRARLFEDQVAELNARLEARSAELETVRNRQAELTGQLEVARQNEAELASKWDVLRKRHDALLPELETLRGQYADRSARLEAVRAAEEHVRAELAAASDREQGLAGELEALRRRCRQLEAAASAADERAGDERIAALAAERDALAGQLDEMRKRLQAAESQAAGRSACDQDMQRRYEMALDDVREMKKKNEQLQNELKAAKASGGMAGDSGALDWEAQKARLLAALENDFGGDAPEQMEGRLEIEKVIEQTDKTLAARDQEIEELKRLLENQSSSLGSVAVGAAALGEIVDKDEIVREERENLKRLQQQWEEKLRKAEVDLSVERAKIARERAELDEKLHALAETSGKGRSAKDDEGKDSKGGRWLARLGLKDEKS